MVVLDQWSTLLDGSVLVAEKIVTRPGKAKRIVLSAVWKGAMVSLRDTESASSQLTLSFHEIVEVITQGFVSTDQMTMR